MPGVLRDEGTDPPPARDSELTGAPQSSAYVYCLVNSSGHPNLSNGTDFGEGTAHWVCSG